MAQSGTIKLSIAHGTRHAHILTEDSGNLDLTTLNAITYEIYDSKGGAALFTWTNAGSEITVDSSSQLTILYDSNITSTLWTTLAQRTYRHRLLFTNNAGEDPHEVFGGTLTIRAKGADGTSTSSTTFTYSDGATSTTMTATLAAQFPVIDTTPLVKGSADGTKKLRIEVDGFTAGQTRVMTPPDEDFTAVGVASTQTLTGKTVNLGSNTLVTTLAQLNAAVSDATLSAVDAASVGAAISGETTITPVDADSIATIDDTDGSLKRVLYSAIKTFLGFVAGVLGIASGGTGASTRQGAIDALTDVASASTGQVLRKSSGGNAAFETLSTGDVVGPSSSVDNTYPRYDSTTGKLLQGSKTAEDDTGKVTINAANTGASTVTGLVVGIENSNWDPEWQFVNRGGNLELIGSNIGGLAVRLIALNAPGRVELHNSAGQIVTWASGGFLGIHKISPGATIDVQRMTSQSTPLFRLLDTNGTTVLTSITYNGTNLVVNTPNLPTSDPLVAGQWWNNSGVLTISAG